MHLELAMRRFHGHQHVVQFIQVSARQCRIVVRQGHAQVDRADRLEMAELVQALQAVQVLPNAQRELAQRARLAQVRAPAAHLHIVRLVPAAMPLAPAAAAVVDLIVVAPGAVAQREHLVSRAASRAKRTSRAKPYAKSSTIWRRQAWAEQFCRAAMAS
jgi:hypothetical protein